MAYALLKRPSRLFLNAQPACSATATGSNQPLQLFDVVGDPAENHDVATSHPDLVARFETYLKTALTQSPYWPDTTKQSVKQMGKRE